MPPSLKNIWVAAGDGDLPRVQVCRITSHSRYSSHLNETSIGIDRTPMQVSVPSINLKSHKKCLTAISPNAPDPFTYTPMCVDLMHNICHSRADHIATQACGGIVRSFRYP